MHLKTSTKISIKFTVFTLIVVAFFGIAHNILFFRSRYTNIHGRFQRPIEMMEAQGRLKLVPWRKHMQQFSASSEEANIMSKNLVRKNIWYYENERYMFVVQDKNVLVTLVTQQIEAQISLLQTTLVLLIIFGIAWYFLSLVFVKTSLQKLQELVTFAQGIRLHTLDQKFPRTWPPNDEINIVATTLEESYERIHTQTQALKDFVRSASHEIKTPLAIMLTEIDYALKAKKYVESLDKMKYHIKHMNALLDTLLLIAKTEDATQFVKHKKNIWPIVREVCSLVQEKYMDKHLTFHVNVDTDTHRAIHEESFRSICKNILENACKYTPEKWEITVTLTPETLTITDTGIGIAPENISKVRDRFRQADTARSDTNSFGLWLYLVKLFVEKHGRTSTIESTQGKWTSICVRF